MFIALYEDSTYDIDLPYDKFAKYEMWHKLVVLVVEANTRMDDLLALFGQQASPSSSKKQGKREKEPQQCYLLCMDAVKGVEIPGW